MSDNRSHWLRRFASRVRQVPSDINAGQSKMLAVRKRTDHKPPPSLQATGEKLSSYAKGSRDYIAKQAQNVREKSLDLPKKIPSYPQQMLSSRSVTSDKVSNLRKSTALKVRSPLKTTGEKLNLFGGLRGRKKEPNKKLSKKLGNNGAKQGDEKEEQLALANALSRIVLSSADLNELCEGFAGELKDLVPIDWAAVCLIDKPMDVVRLSPLSAKINSTWELGDVVPMGRTPIEWMMENEKAMLEPDLERKSRFHTGSYLLKQKVKSVVYMPLFSRREIFGGMIIGSHAPYIYNERELKLLKYTTTQLAMAIENTRLFKETGEGLKREADFIATLTHELKTPLTPIRASGELLAEELQKDSQSVHVKLAENILRSAHTMDHKISEMMELAKVQSPTFKLQIKSIDVKPLAYDVVDQLRLIAKDKVQGLDLDVPASLPKVNGDENQVKRIMSNLLLNAILLSPMGGSIELSVKKQKKELVVSVKDSGKGFLPEEQGHLFDVYYASASHEVDRQDRPLELRLRLAICRRLVEMHKGRIWVESKQGKGSIFSFALPLK